MECNDCFSLDDESTNDDNEYGEPLCYACLEWRREEDAADGDEDEDEEDE